ncbi:MAG: hypothetical protein GF355_02530, partial [Candidatus Eisenbacteria bacterium]|nr:hypothetical protein [Candidatus Eisenbacteria bacterium]
MKGVSLIATVVLALGIAVPGVLANENAEELGYREDTQIIHGPDEEFCPGATLTQNDDGSFENGYAWSSAGVVEPDYGSWAECFDADYVCGVQLLFSQVGYYAGQDIDVYVWDVLVDGDPPPGPDPGNVICVLPGVVPDPPAFWPDVSAHDFQVCCLTEGPHFVGFWPNWPGTVNGWFIASDENGAGAGCPRTKFAPGLGYPTGWNHPNIVP